MPNQGSRTNRHGMPRHRRARHSEPRQQPIFELPIPAPLPAGAGIPIGRVGALAVALGIGLAATVGLDTAVAYADDGASNGTNDAPSRNAVSPSTSDSDPSLDTSTSPESGDAPPTSPSSPDDSADNAGEASEVGSIADTETDGTDESLPAGDETADTADITASTAEPAETTSPHQSRVSQSVASADSSTSSTSQELNATEPSLEAPTELTEPWETMVSVAPLETSDVSMTSWTPVAETSEAVITSADGAAAVADKSIDSATAPSVTDGPTEPVESLLVLSLLALTRRETTRSAVRDTEDVGTPDTALDLTTSETAVEGDSEDAAPALMFSALMADFGAASSASPTGTASVVTGIEDSTRIGGQLTGTDADTDAADLTYAVGSGATHGLVTVDGNGGWTYAPNLNFHGADSFTYIISDGANSSDPVTVTLNITAVNDAPFGTVGMTGSGAEGSVITGTLTGTDVDSTALTYKVKSQATHGTVTVNATTGAWTYTPATNFAGGDSFTYTVSDGKLASTPVAVNITVTPVNTTPTGTDSNVTALEDVATGGLLTGSDVETPTSGLTYTLADGAGHGTASVSSNGTWTYAPATNYDGTDSFTYTITDGAGATSAPVTVTITVTPVNDAPVGTTGLTETGNENTTFGATLTGTDIDTPGGGLSYALGTGPSHGSVTVDVNGTWTYIPDPDYTGADSFTYTVFDGKLRSTPAVVTITVASANSAPIGTNSTVTAVEDTAKIGGKFTGSDAETPVADLTYSIGTVAGHGAATVNADGTWTYTPATNYNGADSFTYIITDGAGAMSAPVNVSVTVAAVNDAPVGTVGLTASGSEGSTITGSLTGSDIDSSNLTFAVKAKPAHGTVTVNANGTWTYTPAINYNGTDTFTYTVSDGRLRSVPVTVTIQVVPVDSPPTGTDSAVTVVEDAATGGTFIGTDVDGDTLSYALDSAAGNGTATVNTNGTWTYTPTTNYTGTDSFTYTVSDGTSLSTPITVTVTVTAVNDAPTGTPGLTGNGNEDSTFGGTLTGTDIDGDTLTYAIDTQAGHGTATVNTNGTWTYTPAVNYTGADSFTYTVSDGSLTSTPVTVTITVTAVNDTPVGTGSSVTAVEDTPTGGTLTGTDIDGDTLSYTLNSPAGNGTATINTNGTWTYTPTVNYTGADSFTYTISDGTLTSTPVTVTVAVAAVNDAPTGTTGLTGNGNEDSTFGGTLTGTDIDGDALTYGLGAQAGHGAVTVNTNGTWTYTPTPNYTGADSFTYTISDGTSLSTPITVTVTVTAVNDAPTGTPGLTGNGNEDSTFGGTLTGTDIDGDTLTYAIDTAAGNGTATVNTNGTWTYTPAVNYTGADSFTYTVSDGTSLSTPVTVTVTVAAVNDAPTGTPGLTGNGNEDSTFGGTLTGSDIDGDTLTYAIDTQAGHGTATVNTNGTWTYTPAVNYTGADSFTYTVSDGALISTPVTVTITVTAVNDTPVGTGSSVTAVEDTPTGGTLTGTDIDGDTLTYAIDTGAGHGTATINTNGTWTYTPTTNYTGADTFTYTVSDGALTSAPVTITITVTAVNDAPTGTPGLTGSGNEDSTFGGTLTGSDIDNPTGSLSYTLENQAGHGTVMINVNGTWTYTPTVNYTGADSFTYTVSDGALISTPVTVTITVTAVNDTPVGTGSSVTAVEDTPTGGTLTGTDIDGDTLTYAIDTAAGNGTATINTNGTWTYTPTTNYNGPDSFTYTISDGTSLSTPITVTVTVTAVNDAPTGTNSTVNAVEDVAASGTLVGADIDSPTGSLSYTLQNQAGHGTVMINVNGTWTYTPAANYTGADSFTYTISDGALTSTPVTATVNLAPVNDAPTGTDSTVTGIEDSTRIGGQLTGADVDNTATELVYTLDTDASHGAVTVNADGTWTYRPINDYNGPDSFTYTVNDGQLISTPVTVTIAVPAVNDRPVGTPGLSQTGNEDTVINGTVTGTDTETPTGGLTYALSGQAGHGTVIVNTDGAWTYTPAADYHGDDTFTFTVYDQKLHSAPVSVTIHVTPVNDAPTATDSAVTTVEDNSSTGGTVAGTDIDGDTLTYAIGASASNGTATVNADGSWTYTPTANYSGTDSFTYTVTDGTLTSTPVTVTITVTAVNDAPTATDSGTNADEDSTTIGGALTGTDIDGDALSYVVGTPAAHGTVTLSANGTWTYTPAANFNGTDSFSYTVSDGALTSAPATVTVTVAPVNDAPTADDSVISGSEDTPFGGTLTAVDIDSNADDLRFTLGDQAANGTVTVNANGTWTYTPDQGFSGDDFFTYTVDDSNADSALVTVVLHVAAVNGAPAGHDASATGNEDTAVTGTLTGTDFDTDAADLSYYLGTGTAHGTVIVNANGTWTYTPAANYNGTDSFTYTVFDGALRSDPATVIIHVIAVNDVPTGADAGINVTEDVAASGTFVGADVDSGTALSYTLQNQAGHGTVTINPNGTWTYTPTTNYTGADSFTYTVTDGTLISTPVTVTVNLAAVNDTPNGTPGLSGNGNEDSTFGGTLTGTDVDGSSLTYAIDSAAGHGTVTVNANGTWSYTPAANYTGADSFTYTVTDGTLISTPTTVTITVAAVNDAPTGTDSSVNATEDVATGGTLVGADIDNPTGSLSYTLQNQAGNGTATINTNGTWTYTPTTNYNGPDSFTYTVTDGTLTSTPVTVTVNLAAVNDTPTATTGLTGNGNEDSTFGGTLTGTDIDGDTLTYAIDTQAGNGTVTINTDGTWTYTPTTNYNGPDSFTYTVTDGTLTSTPVTVTVTVTGVNDTPTATTGLTGNGNEDSTFGGTLTGTDIEGDTLTYGLNTQAGNGTATVNANGTWSYTPAADYNGADSFTYTVTDGQAISTPVTVTITIDAVNDTPTGTDTTVNATEDVATGGTLVGADVDSGTSLSYTLQNQASNGTATINTDGTWTYTPTTNYNGPDSFTYTVTDGQAISTPITVTITVTAVNDAPTGTNSTIDADEDSTTIGGTLLGADIDSPTGSLSYTLQNQASNGTATINTDGTWTYTPTTNYNGSDSFTYTVTDGQAISTPVSVTVNLAAVNDAPTGTTELTGNGNEDTSFGGTLTGTDIDGDTLTYGLATQAGNGTVTVNTNGTWTYTPTANYSGADSFTYTVTDGTLTSTPTTVTITVTAINDAPTGTNSTIDADEDSTTIGGTLLGTDIETADPSQLSYVLDTDTDHGAVNLNEDGTWTYTPNANYTGTDTFTYTIIDADGASSDPVTVTINLLPINDAPVGTTGLAASGAEDSPGGTGGTLTATDADSSDALAYALGNQAANGTVTVDADGTWTYSPDANFNGTDTFTYTVSDGTLTSTPVTVTITVTAVNDTPTGTTGLTGSGSEDTAITGTLTGTDIDGDTLTYGLNTQAGNGTATVNTDGTWAYTPAANYNGTDTFTYTVTDGQAISTPVTVTITTTAVNDTPVAQGDSYSTAEDTALAGSNLLTNDTDVDAGDTRTVTNYTQPAHGSITINGDGSFTYTPAANYNGTDGFSYTISDQNGLTSTASVTIAVTAVNDRPVGNPDNFTTAEDSPYSGNVLANDIDADGNTLTASVIVGPQHGSLQWNSNGTFTYTPDANYNGIDTFTYQASDGPMATTATLVTMSVTAVNDGPTAGGAVSGGSGNEDTVISGSVSFGDVDTGDTTAPDSTTLSVTTQAQHGTVVLNQNGSYTYTPTGNYNGADTFTYTVTDSLGLTATTTVGLSVAAVNDAPVAGSDSFGTIQESSVKATPSQVIGNVLTNDTDVDSGDTRTVTSHTQPTAAGGSTGTIGTVTVAPNGNVTYTPAADGYYNHDGVVTFSYTVTDGSGATSTNTVSFAVNDDISPTAVTTQTTHSGALGEMTTGDTITYTFSEPIDPASIIAGWNGSGSQTVTVRAYDGSVGLVPELGTNDYLQVYNGSDTTHLALGSVGLGSTTYVNGITAPSTAYIWYSNSTMTMSADRTSVTITLGTYNYPSSFGFPIGAVRGINLIPAAMIWLPDTAVRDTAGNSGSGTSATETGASDYEF